MCGIAGELDLARTPDPAALRRMSHAIRHRGPDAEGFFEEGPIALAHRRLSILDLVSGGQPMARAGCTLVFNGEIYGFAELRRELEGLGERFETRSDTEVVLAAYLRWGEDFAARLDGMFAIALWDGRAKKLVLARDRAGKKPIYYALETAGGLCREGSDERPGGALRRFAFASEPKALVAHGGWPLTPDRCALVRYLAAEAVPGERSAFAEIRRVPPAHVAVVDASGLRLRRYWELPYEGDERASLDRKAAELRELLEGAVSRRLVADVPVGVFLSGGIDSSSITACAVRGHPGVSTFSIAFDEASFDESPYAERVARELGTDHHVERLSADACVKLVPDAAEILDEPFADPSFFPTLLLARFARGHVKVALGGDGGDELFAGYDPFLAHLPARAAGALPSPALRLAAALAARLPASSANMSLDFRVKQFLRGLLGPPELRHASWLASFSPAELRALVVPELRPYAADDEPFRDALAGAQADVRAGVSPASVEAALRYYFHRYLADDILVKADRASMAASLEVRSPFLDPRIIEWTARLPARFKLSLTETKRILRRAVAPLVPREVLERPKKGFGIPVARWIRGPLRPLFEELFSEASLRQSGLLEAGPTRALLARHLEGRADLRKPLWTLMMLLLWQRRWGSAVSREGTASAA